MRAWCFFGAQYKATQTVENFITDYFLNTCVPLTNAQEKHNEKFTRFYPGGISEDESGRVLLRAYLAIEWHLPLLRYKRREWAWLVDSLK